MASSGCDFTGIKVGRVVLWICACVECVEGGRFFTLLFVLFGSWLDSDQSTTTKLLLLEFLFLSSFDNVIVLSNIALPFV